MNKVLDVVEDMKQNITDNHYKTILESLMEINETNKVPLLYGNQERNKLVCLFNWLDTKLEITEYKNDGIKRSDLLKYVITNYFDYRYYENIDFVKQILKFYFKNKIILMNICMSNLDMKKMVHRKKKIVNRKKYL